MTNFNTIIITTGLSVIFGLYSFYGLINYLEKDGLTNNDMISRKMSEILRRYNKIEIKYKSLLVENIILKDEINILSRKFIDLENNKVSLFNCINYDPLPLENVSENIVEEENKIIYNTVSENKDTIKINDDIINMLVKLEEEKEREREKEKEEKEKDEDHEFEVLEKSYTNEHITKNRTRVKSISEINWTEATKKFIFG